MGTTGAIGVASPAGVDDHHLGVQCSGSDGPLHRRGQCRRGMGAVGQQDLDQPPGSRGVTLRGAGRVPVGLMAGGEHTAAPRLGQGGGSGQRAGLGLEDLEVVIQGQDVDEPPDSPVVAGDDRRTVEDLDRCRAEAHGQPATRRTGPGPNSCICRTDTRASSHRPGR